MDCRQVQDYLQEKIGKKIPRHMGSVIKEHLSDCTDCKGVYREILKEKKARKKKGKASSKKREKGEKSKKSDSREKEKKKSKVLEHKFPGYKIVGNIGRGAMGHVYQAFQVSLKRNVALKVLSGDLSKNAKFVKRFLREARALGEMKHPNVVQVYDVGFSRGLFYYIMEFVEGYSLKDLLDEKGTLPPEEALDICIQTTEALIHAEEHNIVHRDIKPGNILVDKDGTCKLADLGLAKKRWQNEKMSEETKVGTLIGTPHYMAPEQIRNSRDVNIQADIYSLGVTFYQMLTGGTPFKGSTNFEVLSSILQDPIDFDEKRDQHIPEDYQKVILKMMAKDLEHRWRGPRELLGALKKLKGGREIEVSLPSDHSSSFFLGNLEKSQLIFWSALVGALSCMVILLLSFVIFKTFWTPPDDSGQVKKTPPKNGTLPPKEEVVKRPDKKDSGKKDDTSNSTFKVAYSLDEIYQKVKGKHLKNGDLVKLKEPVFVEKKHLHKTRGNRWITRLVVNDGTRDLRIFFPFAVDESKIQCGDHLIISGQVYKSRFGLEISYKFVEDNRPLIWKKHIEKIQTKTSQGFTRLAKVEPPLEELSQLKKNLYKGVYLRVAGEGKNFRWIQYRFGKKRWRKGEKKMLGLGEIEVENKKYRGRLYFVIDDWVEETLRCLGRKKLVQNNQKLLFLGRWQKIHPGSYSHIKAPEFDQFHNKWVLMVKDIRPLQGRDE